MMMGLSLSMGHSLELEQTLSQKQRLGQQLGLIQALVWSVRGEKMSPSGTCPNCRCKLTPAEILLGFNRDPNDYTTKCPRCLRRFQPILLHRTSISSMEVAFLCPSQTLARLPALVTLPLDEIRQTHASVFRSAEYHFGNLKIAFEKAGLIYRGEKLASFPAWQRKVFRFLGKLPDTVIAKHLNVSCYAVKKLRKERGVDSCQTRVWY